MLFKALLKAWIGRKTGRNRAAQIYELIVQKARDPFLFREVKLPDSPQGRFESIVLHMFLVQQRFQSVDDPGSLPQKLMDRMAEDFDHSIREMGVGDLSVGKNVKKLSRAALSRFNFYKVRADDSGDLTKALEHVFKTGVMQGEEVNVQKLATYVNGMAQGLSNYSDHALIAGKLSLGTILDSD